MVKQQVNGHTNCGISIQQNTDWKTKRSVTDARVMDRALGHKST